jgi:hypothetical protein
MERDRYLELLAPAIELASTKSQDYQSGFVKLEMYFPFADKSYIQMLNVKVLRLISLAEGKTPNFESIEDTVLDLANYAVFYLNYLEKQKCLEQKCTKKPT